MISAIFIINFPHLSFYDVSSRMKAKAKADLAHATSTLYDNTEVGPYIEMIIHFKNL